MEKCFGPGVEVYVGKSSKVEGVGGQKYQVLTSHVAINTVATVHGSKDDAHQNGG